MTHPELPAEQAHVDHAYARLEAMRAAATGMLQEAFGERGGTFQSFTERDIRVRTSLSRLEQLQIGDEALVFGRIDRVGDEVGGDEVFHIGRLAISDTDQEPLVVDWRAPVVEPFYRATGAHPMGLRLRRHFLTDGRKLLDLEDELFDEEGTAEGVGLGLSGSQVLLAALSRARTGRMRDIVATVQREQDEIIRGPLGGVLVVQGGPGTGKTAVALHRAAYLLYTHRFPLESQGVLVVGPNPTFLRYISHVLPSLGESGVELSTIAGLYGHATGRRSERVETARLKGSARMVSLVARAVKDRQRSLRRTVEIPYGSAVLRLTPDASAQIVAAAKRRPGTHNARRRTVERLLWRHLLEEVHRRIPAGPVVPVDLADEYLFGDGSRGDSGGGGGDAGPAGEIADIAGAAGWSNIVPFARPTAPSTAPPAGDSVWTGAPSPPGGRTETGRPAAASPASPLPGDDEVLTEAELGRQLRGRPEVATALDRIWPVLSAEALLHDLFGARPLVDLAAGSSLSDEEKAALVRARSGSLGEVQWTPADIALLDEARALLGPPNRRVAADEADDIRRYGHIVVDEAQDLSPMQLRMLGRRSLGGSMTIVGDIAQATGSWAPAAWSAVVAHLPSDRGWRQVDLTVNYRTPSEIMDLAGRVLASAVPGMLAPESVRYSGEPVRFVGVDSRKVSPGDDLALVAEVQATAAAELMALAGGPGGDGRLAIIAPPSLLGALSNGLRAAGIGVGIGYGADLEAPAVLLAVEECKGLEFDGVLVVEPARIARESAQQLRAVYVAMTRTTRRLAVVHAEALPEALSPTASQHEADGTVDTVRGR